MKKIFAMILMVAMLMCLCAGAALAENYAYITDTAHVRSGPGVGYTKVAILKEDSTVPYMQQVRYDSKGQAWYRVSYGADNATGWVMANYVRLTNTPGNATYGSGGGADKGKYNNLWNTSTVVANGNVNVRRGPGLSYEIVGTMHKEDTALYLGSTSYDERGVMWYNISFKDTTGWVSSTYAQLNNGGAWYGMVTIVDGKCNVRTGPALTYKTLGTAFEEEVLVYLGNTTYDSRGIAWYNVSFENESGWVSSVYAQLQGVDAPLWCQWAEIVEGKSNVRTGPGLAYKALGVVYEGEILTYLGNTSYDERGVAWHNVSFNGKDGWVSSVYSKLY